VIAAALTFAGIVLPSLLVIAAVRRWIAPLPWRIAFLLLLLTLAFLHGAVFGTRLPVPVDEVARGYPYRGVVGEVRPRNPLTNDTVKLFLPWMQVAREELLNGRAPLWNPYSFSGYPLLGNGESAPFSPIFLATLFVPLPKQIVAMAGLKIFFGLVFGYLFLKREGVSDAASCLGAAAFAFSVYQTTVLYYSAASVRPGATPRPISTGWSSSTTCASSSSACVSSSPSPAPRSGRRGRWYTAGPTAGSSRIVTGCSDSTVSAPGWRRPRRGPGGICSRL
jgi:hypothetical protein